MKVLGIRFCRIHGEAATFADTLERALGLERSSHLPPGESFEGAVFPVGEDSWIELWPAEKMDLSMLQLVVDDADAYAEHARRAGFDPQGPTDAHGERIYTLTLPTGEEISFQSITLQNEGWERDRSVTEPTEID